MVKKQEKKAELVKEITKQTNAIKVIEEMLSKMRTELRNMILEVSQL